MVVTYLELLKGISAYPIPIRTLIAVSGRWGIALSEEPQAEVLQSREYNLCVAELLLWLSIAPNISQGGQSYSFSEDERKQLRSRAYGIYDAWGVDGKSTPKTLYGYKGSRL